MDKTLSRKYCEKNSPDELIKHMLDDAKALSLMKEKKPLTLPDKSWIGLHTALQSLQCAYNLTPLQICCLADITSEYSRSLDLAYFHEIAWLYPTSESSRIRRALQDFVARTKSGNYVPSIDFERNRAYVLQRSKQKLHDYFIENFESMCKLGFYAVYVTDANDREVRVRVEKLKIRGRQTGQKNWMDDISDFVKRQLLPFNDIDVRLEEGEILLQ
jgi:hypothetical protein